MKTPAIIYTGNDLIVHGIRNGHKPVENGIVELTKKLRYLLVLTQV